MSSLSLRGWYFKAQKRHELKIGRDVTDEEFASLLGMSRSYLTKIKSGDRTTISKEQAEKTYRATGDITIFDAAGYPRPDPVLLETQRALTESPPDDREKLSRRLEELLKEWANETGYELREIK